MILPVTERNIARVIAVLRAGGLAALPTETVYGLAGDATSGAAVAAIFAAKGRPQFNPLIAHVSSQGMAARYVDIDPLSQKLIDAFWPGPLTLVLPLRESSGIHPLTTAGLPTLAVRNPQGVFSEIIARLDVPLAAPSANRSGSISPTTAAAVVESLQDRVSLVLDGGACSVGVESTIIKVEGDKVFLLRPGGLPGADIERVTGRKLQKPDAQAAVQAPGMLKSHYAPNAAVRLEVTELRAREALLAFGAQRAKGYENAVALLNLSPTGNMEEAAGNLFSYLHALDRPDIAAIAVEPIPYTGLGEAINDRLQRAAAPRGLE